MKFTTCFAFLLIATTSLAQTPEIPAEAQTFIPAGFEILDYQTGDLNGDKQLDALMILKQAGEDSVMEDEMHRPLLLLIRQSNGQLKQVLRNDSAVLCRHCGGVFGDPYEGTTIGNRGFSLSFYGGSSWRWGITYEFVYRAAKNNWYLVKESHAYFHSGDPEATMKTTDIPEQELGEISLAKFTASPAHTESKWKVIAAKTFFYDSPRLGSKPRKAYLLKGNTATGIRHLKNFIELSFENKKGGISTGYILRKDLQLVK